MSLTALKAGEISQTIQNVWDGAFPSTSPNLATGSAATVVSQDQPASGTYSNVGLDPYLSSGLTGYDIAVSPESTPNVYPLAGGVLEGASALAQVYALNSEGNQAAAATKQYLYSSPSVSNNSTQYYNDQINNYMSYGASIGSGYLGSSYLGYGLL